LIPDFSVLEGDYLRDILEQPGCLRDTLAELTMPRKLGRLAAKLNQGKFKRVVLTGMGSSFHALHPLNLQLVANGFTSIMVETSELIHYQERFLDRKTLLVAVSQSGQSAEMVRLLELNRKQSPIIAVTNSPDGSLASGADAALLTRAGNEFSVSCKTYVTALMALKWLGDVLCEEKLDKSTRELREAQPSVENYLSGWRDHVAALVDGLTGIRHLLLVGRGSSLAAVGTGALIIKESAHFHAEGMSSAGFRHGPFEMLSGEIFVLVFTGDFKTRDLNYRLWQDLREREGRTELVSEEGTSSTFRLSEVPPSIVPILEILPVQMITLALATHANREPGRFELASKITTAE
jgi:glucosamine--fructose-6-phosphate aminotransferase (isomerizing)